ncbi:phage major capsid protein [bacterium]|nr:phage major capsid protein [bacterium]
MATSANPNFDEIITTTLKNRTGKIADNVTNNNALLRVLSSKGNMMLEDGGQTLVEELDFQENGTFKYYSGNELLNVDATDVDSAAEYDWKQAAVSVQISGLKQRQNMGSNRVINLLAAKVKNAESTMANNLSTGIYSDGTGSSGKQIGGLQSLVADAPSTGTVGGINRANYSFWRNIAYDATTDGGAAATAANIQDYMNAVWIQLVRGSDNPDTIVADNNYYNLFQQSLQSIQRITSAKSGSAGFESLEYCGSGGSAPVILDNAAGTNHMYFLNTDYLFWKAHRDCNFAVTDEKQSINQDAIVKQILFMGNMTASNCSLQGVLKD